VLAELAHQALLAGLCQHFALRSRASWLPA